MIIGLRIIERGNKLTVTMYRVSSVVQTVFPPEKYTNEKPNTTK